MARISTLICIFPCLDIENTARFYTEKLGFRAVPYLDIAEPHICLYRDKVEIVLTKTGGRPFRPNHELYGYGEDAYFITDTQAELLDEFREKGIKIVQPLRLTDYQNREFVIEDCDGRRLAFGIKEG